MPTKFVKIDLVDTIAVALSSNALDDDERLCLREFMEWRSTSHLLVIVQALEIVSEEEARVQ